MVNGIIHSMLCQYTSGQVQLVLIDPKRVELIQWASVPHCITYASEPGDRVAALEWSIAEIDRRYKSMQRRLLRKYDGGHIYIVIDELADLMTTQKKAVLPLLQRIAQIGRAANVHIIAATQCPTAQVLSTQLRCNFDALLGLRTRSIQDSRNIISRGGCEQLPAHGKGYYVRPGDESIVSLPLIPDSEIERVVSHWTNRRLYVA